MDITVIVPIIIAILSPGVWIAIIQHNKTKAEAKKADAESNKADAEAKKIEAETAEIIQRITAEQLAMSEKRMDEKELECKQRIDELEKDNKSIKAQLIVIKRDMKNILTLNFIAGDIILESGGVSKDPSDCVVKKPD